MKTNQEIREKLGGYVETFSVKAGVITVRRGFFYTHGQTSEDFVNQIRAKLHGYLVKVVDQGEVWKAFRGGASCAQQSHWFVKFTATDVSPTLP